MLLPCVTATSHEGRRRPILGFLTASHEHVPGSPTDAAPSVLCARLLEAFNQREWAQLERLYHPEALLTTLAAHGASMTGDELVGVLRAAADDHVYDFEVHSIVDVDERACLASGRLRQRVEGGGFADREVHWLYVFQQSLLWRSGIYPSPLAARQALQRDGHSLGIGDPRDSGRRETGRTFQSLPARVA